MVLLVKHILRKHKSKVQIIEAVVRRCSQKFCKFHKKISVLESLFNKAEALQFHQKETSITGVFLWKLQKFLKISFLTVATSEIKNLMKYF